MKYDIEKIIQIIKKIAKQEVLPYFANIERQYKSDGSVVTQVDHDMQQGITFQLNKLYPEILMLAEEMSHAEQQAVIESGEPFWCLDPLDGTNNFAAGIPYFSVSMALIIDKKVSLGIVYDPVRDELFSATDQGANLNGVQIKLNDSGLLLKQSIGIIDLKRLQKSLAVKLVTDAPYSSQRSFGSVALDWCWLAMKRGHVYLHGQSNLWDYVAGHYIFKIAGGHSSTLDGGDVFINELMKRSSVAAVDESLFKEWRLWIEQNSAL